MNRTTFSMADVNEQNAQIRDGKKVDELAALLIHCAAQGASYTSFGKVDERLNKRFKKQLSTFHMRLAISEKISLMRATRAKSVEMQLDELCNSLGRSLIRK